MTIIETREIGISFEVGQGEFVKTEFVDGSLRLKKVGETPDLEPVYEDEGYWQSNVIDTADKFREYDKIAIDKVQFTKDLYKVETRTSDDGVNFNPYVAITAGGNIVSPMKRYIQIKITLYAGFLQDAITVSSFNNRQDVTKWEDRTYIETDGVLKLKRNYKFNMSEDKSWTDDGHLLRKKIARSYWKKIDSLNI